MSFFYLMARKIIIGRNESDRKKFGNKGTLLLGKQYVTMGKTKSLSTPVYLDAIRPHIVLVDGKRGSGKCLPKDALIPLEDGRVIPIKELAKENSDIYSLDEDWKIKRGVKTEFYERTVDKLLKITLRSGRELKLTPEHPLLKIKGWEEARNFKEGDRIATPRKIPCFGNKEMPDNRVKILAYLIAEGCLRSNFVLFSNSDEEIVEDFKKSIKEFDDNLRINEHSHPDCYRVSQIEKKYTYTEPKRDSKGRFTSNSVRYSRSSINKWLRKHKIYDKLSLDKFIPECIFKLPKYQLALFLNRLFSCDGSIYKHKASNGSIWKISYSSSSKKLSKQVQHLLLRFGILSRLRTKKVKYNSKYFKTFELVLSTSDVLKFIEEIGFYGAKKKLETQASVGVEKLTRNPNVDTIPKEIWDIYRPNNWAEIGRKMGYSIPKGLRTSIKYSPSRQKLAQIALLDDNPQLYKLANSDVFWDEIVEIEELEGEFKVYDIEVPGTHNFIANDVIVHNSYSLGVMAEGLADLPKQVSKNISTLIFDTMGIYWTMKYPNYKDDELLNKWDLKPNKLNPIIYCPVDLFDQYQEKEIPVDEPFSIKPSDVGAEQFCKVFGIDLVSEEGILLQKVLRKAKEKHGKNFSIDDVIKLIKKSDSSEKLTKVLVNRFNSVKEWGIFSKEATDIEKLFKGGTTNVLDLSAYSEIEGGKTIKSLVIGILCRKILQKRLIARKGEEVKLISEGGYLAGESSAVTEEKAPLAWIMIDEVHQFLPEEGETLATPALIQLLREGRQPGISLALATQQPGKIHTDVLTQSDIVLSHRLTAKVDLDALDEIMQTYLTFNITKYINNLPKVKGAGIILDDNSEKIYPLRVRPRMSWHGGEDPTAIRGKIRKHTYP